MVVEYLKSRSFTIVVLVLSFISGPFYNVARDQVLM